MYDGLVIDHALLDYLVGLVRAKIDYTSQENFDTKTFHIGVEIRPIPCLNIYWSAHFLDHPLWRFDVTLNDQIPTVTVTYVGMPEFDATYGPGSDLFDQVQAQTEIAAGTYGL